MRASCRAEWKGAAACTGTMRKRRVWKESRLEKRREELVVLLAK
jgi:hypothetical protein